jgi:hypothetical protein
VRQCGTNCKERREGECKGVTKCNYLTSSAKAYTTERERERERAFAPALLAQRASIRYTE